MFGFLKVIFNKKNISKTFKRRLACTSSAAAPADATMADNATLDDSPPVTTAGNVTLDSPPLTQDDVEWFIRHARISMPKTADDWYNNQLPLPAAVLAVTQPGMPATGPATVYSDIPPKRARARSQKDGQGFRCYATKCEAPGCPAHSKALGLQSATVTDIVDVPLAAATAVTDVTAVPASSAVIAKTSNASIGTTGTENSGITSTNPGVSPASSTSSVAGTEATTPDHNGKAIVLPTARMLPGLAPVARPSADKVRFVRPLSPEPSWMQRRSPWDDPRGGQGGLPWTMDCAVRGLCLITEGRVSDVYQGASRDGGSRKASEDGTVQWGRAL
ncbi:hypothetical protein CALCODRAFT_556208 [Calocera cornea HHB12733]|uniref:Uncharacterized protein n=1 Tax=Calocera cornea HHB12733 TaxID=1353952 RepID=A0A165EZL5_9BASI|nr:hypothetical protein CALCODRAFT_556208 [Calocera cornea HHB12733]